MINKLKQLISHYNDLSDKMSNPDIITNIKKYTALAKEYRGLREVVQSAKVYLKKFNQLQEDEEILQGDDKELKELVKDEIVSLKEELERLENKLKILLLPQDPKRG